MIKKECNMKKYVFLLFVFCFISLTTGCKTNKDFFIRSGDIHNDDVEEPLSDEVTKFQSNLELSNEIVDELKQKELSSVYDSYFSEIENSDTFQSNWTKIFETYGDIKSFKKQQWHFAVNHESNNKFLSSIKIVHHEKASFNYIFIFNLKEPDKLFRFKVDAR
jgi:hypothetical protein